MDKNSFLLNLNKQFEFKRTKSHNNYKKYRKRRKKKKWRGDLTETIGAYERLGLLEL